MSRRIWTVFIAVQLFGLLCFWTWGYVSSQVGAAMWGTALITLFPGNFVSGFLVDRLLWKSPLTAVQMSVIDVPVEVAINACVWFLCVRLLRLIKHLRRSRSVMLTVLLGVCLLSWGEGQIAPNPKNADRIVIVKNARSLTLLNQGQVLKTYKVALGGNPVGPKSKAGDKKTPEGEYIIDSKNPHSRFHFALHISYPNSADRERARKLGVSPGGGVEIHGLEPKYAWVGSLHREINWTAGCVAVTNPEIEEIYKLVPVGTPVEIRADEKPPSADSVAPNSGNHLTISVVASGKPQP
jgi:hypothetical protein